LLADGGQDSDVVPITVDAIIAMAALTIRWQIALHALRHSSEYVRWEHFGGAEIILNALWPLNRIYTVFACLHETVTQRSDLHGMAICLAGGA
jgi:hypothetical protein